MAVITYIREAKCKDCKHCADYYKGKLKRHRCENEKSESFSKQIRLNDKVCSKWEL